VLIGYAKIDIYLRDWKRSGYINELINVKGKTKSKSKRYWEYLKDS